MPTWGQGEGAYDVSQIEYDWLTYLQQNNIDSERADKDAWLQNRATTNINKYLSELTDDMNPWEKLAYLKDKPEFNTQGVGEGGIPPYASALDYVDTPSIDYKDYDGDYTAYLENMVQYYDALGRSVWGQRPQSPDHLGEGREATPQEMEMYNYLRERYDYNKAAQQAFANKSSNLAGTFIGTVTGNPYAGAAAGAVIGAAATKGDSSDYLKNMGSGAVSGAVSGYFSNGLEGVFGAEGMLAPETAVSDMGDVGAEIAAQEAGEEVAKETVLDQAKNTVADALKEETNVYEKGMKLVKDEVVQAAAETDYVPPTSPTQISKPRSFSGLLMPKATLSNAYDRTTPSTKGLL